MLSSVRNTIDQCSKEYSITGNRTQGSSYWPTWLEPVRSTCHTHLKLAIHFVLIGYWGIGKAYKSHEMTSSTFLSSLQNPRTNLIRHLLIRVRLNVKIRDISHFRTNLYKLKGGKFWEWKFSLSYSSVDTYCNQLSICVRYHTVTKLRSSPFPNVDVQASWDHPHRLTSFPS